MWKLFKKGGMEEATVSERPELTRREAMKCVPVRNEAVREVELSETCVRLEYPIRFKPWFARLAGALGGDAAPPDKKLELDEMGSFCWKQINGNRTVNDIVSVFVDFYKLHPEEARSSVSAFVRDLGKRGLIALRPPDDIA